MQETAKVAGDRICICIHACCCVSNLASLLKVTNPQRSLNCMDSKFLRMNSFANSNLLGGFCGFLSLDDDDATTDADIGSHMDLLISKRNK